MTAWQNIRPSIANIKKTLFNRPLGLKRFGFNSALLRPWKVVGAPMIEIGERTTIRPDSNLWAISEYEGKRYNPSLIIGSCVYIGPHVFLTTIDSLTIEDGCVLSEHVYITDFFHGLDPTQGPIMQRHLESKGPVHLGRGCFLGFRVAVMPGVTLGEHCVVGANSVVTRSFPPYSMLAGSPAHLIKRFSLEQRRWVSCCERGAIR